jgi:hypothetical protein
LALRSALRSAAVIERVRPSGAASVALIELSYHRPRPPAATKPAVNSPARSPVFGRAAAKGRP